jgi:hypothetical protein
MKLSMWMIANRIMDLDPELHISENAPAILNSARMVYATNCVHVYQEEDYVVCNGEGDYIKLYDIDVRQTFEIIQGIFDFFEDWIDKVLDSAYQKDYQRMVDLAWQVFHEPIMLFDSNRKLLGITRQYSADSMDEEWAYISQYGYTSLNAVAMMKHKKGKIDFMQPGFHEYSYIDSRFMNHGGLTYSMFSEDVYCGRINVLSTDREFNRGDYQILEKLARLLEPILGRAMFSDIPDEGNIFYSLLAGKPYTEESLDIQLEYHKWKRDDTYRLILIETYDALGREVPGKDVNILSNLVSRNLPDAVILKKNPYVIILSNYDLMEMPGKKHFLYSLKSHNPVHIGLSFPVRGIDQIDKLYTQAYSAIYYGELTDKSETFHSFYDYALDFIIDSSSIESSVSACLPMVTELWKQHRENGDELFETLKIYLENNCSISRTSTEMYTHRNTILYRINKIKEMIGYDLEDAYCRDYCRLSIRALELYEKKQKKNGAL